MTAHADQPMKEQFTHDALTIDSDRTLDRLLVPLLRAPGRVSCPQLTG